MIIVNINMHCKPLNIAVLIHNHNQNNMTFTPENEGQDVMSCHDKDMTCHHVMRCKGQRRHIVPPELMWRHTTCDT